MTPDRDELRGLFLFEELSDERLDWLVERGELRTYDTGATVAHEGDPATHLYVLLDGALRLSRLMNGEDVVVVETSHRGAYGGAVRAYVASEDTYSATITTTAPSRFYRLPGPDFSELMRGWFPMAVHLLEGLYVGIRNTEIQVRQREHLANLGNLSANLAHELNNPASATVRASGQLQARVAGMRDRLGLLAAGTVPAESLRALVEVQERAVAAAGEARGARSPVQLADLEDAIADRLDALGVAGGYELAPVFAAAGLDPTWVDEVAGHVDDDLREGALRWLADTLDTEALMGEIAEASTRISALVATVKDYSHLDQASEQDVDLHRGIDSTVVMLGGKLSGIEVVKDYGADLPPVSGWPAELNQVWTNLLDNAAHAVGGRGTITVRTRHDDGDVVVEIGDDGPGIRPEVLPRIWDAFFTTKPAGEGSGLGLDNARRIVERRHRGTIGVDTGADGSTFTVRLPSHAAP